MMKQYEELTIKDDFMFCKIMSEHESLCKTLIEAILGRKISQISKGPNRQQVADVLPDKKAVRFDVMFTDDEKNVYDIEMQTAVKSDLAKRSRYYQGSLDIQNTLKGMDYAEMANTYIVFICDFDFMDERLPCYTFRMRCDETGRALNDGATRIFVCSTGAEETGGVSVDLSAFLSYMNGEIKENRFIMELNNAVIEARTFEPWKLEYMSMYTREQDIRREERAMGIQIGRAEGIQIGEARGEERGRLNVLFNLVNRGLLTYQDAAESADMSESEFREAITSSDVSV